MCIRDRHLEDYVREHKKTGRVFRHIHINHGPDIEKAIEAVKSEVSKNEFIRHKYSTRFLSIKLLENDPDIERIVRTLPNADEIFHVRDKMSKRVQDTMNEDCESAITDAKYGFISGALKEMCIRDRYCTGLGILLQSSTLKLAGSSGRVPLMGRSVCTPSFAPTNPQIL